MTVCKKTIIDAIMCDGCGGSSDTKITNDFQGDHNYMTIINMEMYIADNKNLIFKPTTVDSRLDFCCDTCVEEYINRNTQKTRAKYNNNKTNIK